MSRCLDTYDSSFNTGNKSLDVVLTEKKLLCDNKGIKFFCMADGKLLNGIKVSDIYSLFGNAIDNAIECLADVADEDYIKRIIALPTEELEIRDGQVYIDGIFAG